MRDNDYIHIGRVRPVMYDRLNEALGVNLGQPSVDGYLVATRQSQVVEINAYMSLASLTSVIARLCGESDDIYDAVIKGCIRSQIRPHIGSSGVIDET